MPPTPIAASPRRGLAAAAALAGCLAPAVARAESVQRIPSGTSLAALAVLEVAAAAFWLLRPRPLFRSVLLLVAGLLIGQALWKDWLWGPNAAVLRQAVGAAYRWELLAATLPLPLGALVAIVRGVVATWQWRKG